MPTVLIMAASPSDQDRLSLNREVKKIKQAHERSRKRDEWRIESNEAATVEDLRRALLDFQPSVLHFAGHGGGELGLCFEDDQGETHMTHAEPLAKLLHHFKDKLKCVVLNACYSKVQAEIIRQQIDHVIGMQHSIGDDAATRFSVAFYDSVFAGTTFRMAFDIACAAIDLHNLPDAEVPVYMESAQLGGVQLAYTEQIPAIEDFLLRFRKTPFPARCSLTTQGEPIARAMQQYSGDNMPVPIDKITVMSVAALDNHYWRAKTRLEADRQSTYFIYYLRIVDKDIKLDWEATVGYWTVPPKTYLAFGAPPEGVVARVRAALGNSYFSKWYDKRRRCSEC